MDGCWTSRARDLDAVVGHSFEPRLFVVENTPGGSVVQTLAAHERSGHRIESFDVDGDGWNDLVTASPTNDTIGNVIPRVLVFRRSSAVQATFDPVVAFAGEETKGFVDLDGDGDVDVTGLRNFRNRRFHGAEAGILRQYGEGTPGTGGVVPVLGGSGPL